MNFLKIRTKEDLLQVDNVMRLLGIDEVVRRLADSQHEASRFAERTLSHGTRPQPIPSPPPMRAHHNQIHRLFFGKCQDGLRDEALVHDEFRRQSIRCLFLDHFLEPHFGVGG